MSDEQEQPKKDERPWHERMIPVMFMRGDIIASEFTGDDGKIEPCVIVVSRISFSFADDFLEQVSDPRARCVMTRTVGTSHVFGGCEILNAFDDNTSYVLMSDRKTVRRAILAFGRFARAVVVCLTLVGFFKVKEDWIPPTVKWIKKRLRVKEEQK